MQILIENRGRVTSKAIRPRPIRVCSQRECWLGYRDDSWQEVDPASGMVKPFRAIARVSVSVERGSIRGTADPSPGFAVPLVFAKGPEADIVQCLSLATPGSCSSLLVDTSQSHQNLLPVTSSYRFRLLICPTTWSGPNCPSCLPRLIITTAKSMAARPSRKIQGPRCIRMCSSHQRVTKPARPAAM